MKKRIIKRSVFMVVSCLMLFFSFIQTRPPVFPVAMASDVEEIMGQEASESFSAFLEELQVWYYDHKNPQNGVTLTMERDYEDISALFDAVTPFMSTDIDMTDEAIVTRIDEYTSPVIYIIMTMMEVATQLEQSPEGVSFAPEEWYYLGSIIDEIVMIYAA
jgi:hypothetical protein